MSYTNLSITMKVVCLLLLMALGAMLGTGFAGYEMVDIDKSYNRLVDGPAQGAIEAARVNRAFSDVVTGLYRRAGAETDEPEVTIVQRGEDTVTEYRIRGKLYMVKVTPPHGVPYYLIDKEGTGQMVRHDGAADLAVPMWVIKSW